MHLIDFYLFPGRREARGSHMSACDRPLARGYASNTEHFLSTEIHEEPSIFFIDFPAGYPTEGDADPVDGIAQRPDGKWMDGA